MNLMVLFTKIKNIYGCRGAAGPDDRLIRCGKVLYIKLTLPIRITSRGDNLFPITLKRLQIVSIVEGFYLVQ